MAEDDDRRRWDRYVRLETCWSGIVAIADLLGGRGLSLGDGFRLALCLLVNYSCVFSRLDGGPEVVGWYLDRIVSSSEFSLYSSNSTTGNAEEEVVVEKDNGLIQN